MFQMQMTTDYAIRIMGYVYSKGGELAQTFEIAEKTGVTYPYTMKIINRLKAAGLIQSERGRLGGYRLARNASGITVYDVVRAIEGEICLARSARDADGNASKTAHCHAVHEMFQSIQQDLIEALKGRSICEVWGSSPS